MNQAEARAVLMKGEISRLTEDARVKQAACQDLRRHLASLDLSLQEAKSEVLEAREMHQFTEMELTQCKSSGLELCKRFASESQLRLHAQEENLKLMETNSQLRQKLLSRKSLCAATRSSVTVV
mmetsp:Transcript_79161/g.181214  ORF Transcript_79161/g.181214 Transcript_79161/m.181214 type:complete len:124 (+) Transcript_79161:345-716(+)